YLLSILLSHHFFFSYSGHHPDLHSFPTRRSSDLIAVCMIDPKTKLCFGCGRTLPEIARWGRMSADERLALMDGLAARMHDAGLRSEEHTSELQSRSDLVCRLLLEKKKKKKDKK